MKSTLLMDLSVDKANKKIYVKREFAAPVAKVWSAWTESKMLDQWWAPRPWKTETKVLEFKSGGKWIYAMVGPDGSKHWATLRYNSVTPTNNYSATDAFGDEHGNINKEFPSANWNVNFSTQGAHTLVSIEITYDKVEDLEKMVEMGFQEGFTMALGNLDELLG